MLHQIIRWLQRASDNHIMKYRFYTHSNWDYNMAQFYAGVANFLWKNTRRKQ